MIDIRGEQSTVCAGFQIGEMENFATIWEIGGRNVVDDLGGVWLREKAHDQGV